jgi:hypothetical protein
VQGSFGRKNIALDAAVTNAEVTRTGGKLAVSGTARIGGGLVNGKKFAGAFAYQAAAGRFLLTGGECTLERSVFHFDEISGLLPRKVATGRGGRIPLALRFTGIRGEWGKGGFAGLGGTLNAFLVSEGGERWLEGNGAVTVQSINYGKSESGFLESRLALTRGKTSADITGKVLSGRLTASVQADPFSVAKGVTFSGNLIGAAAAGIAETAGKAMPVGIGGGAVDVATTGRFTPREGVDCQMTLTGRDIALTGKEGKNLLAGGALTLSGEWMHGNLLIREGKLDVGKDLALTLGGELAGAATASREGTFTIGLAQVPLASLQKAAANLLPRSLQGGALAGTVAAQGKFRFQGKRAVLDGEVALKDCAADIPAQKLNIAAINGAIPFSLDFAGMAALRAPEKLRFTRQNYPRLLALLQDGAKKGRTLTIGKVRFGTTELGPTILAIRASDGLTEVESLKSTLFRGALLGHGYFRYQGKVNYGADMLVHDVSLRELCNTYPAIKGYLSGRVDGLVSLFGRGTAVNDLAGYLELWTRSSKDEKMLVSKEFLQKLAGKKFKGIFFREDRPFDRGEIGAWMEDGYLTFDTLDISHTNFLGIRDLSVTVAPVQNRIGVAHLFSAIKEAAARGKPSAGSAPSAPPAEKPSEGEFKWEE